MTLAELVSHEHDEKRLLQQLAGVQDVRRDDGYPSCVTIGAMIGLDTERTAGILINFRIRGWFRWFGAMRLGFLTPEGMTQAAENVRSCAACNGTGRGTARNMFGGLQLCSECGYIPIVVEDERIILTATSPASPPPPEAAPTRTC